MSHKANDIATDNKMDLSKEEEGHYEAEQEEQERAEELYDASYEPTCEEGNPKEY